MTSLRERITQAADDLCKEVIYRDGKMELGLSPGFLMRLKELLAEIDQAPTKPPGYEHFSWSTINAIRSNCSTPASRAGIECACLNGDEAMREKCKDQPQCNKQSNHAQEAT